MRKPSSPRTQGRRRALARRGPRTPECDGLQPSSVRYVGKEAKLAGALDGDRELLLVPAAGARDASRADLALLAHRAAQRAEVLVVDDVDLVAAELAGLAPAASRRTLLVTPARCLLPATCLFHACSLLPVRSQNGMSSSPALPAGVLAKSAVSAGTSDCGVKRPPFSPPPSREPRNWTESAMISIDWRLLPFWSSHSRQLRRPSIATPRPFERYWAQFSPCAPQTVTSK